MKPLLVALSLLAAAAPALAQTAPIPAQTGPVTVRGTILDAQGQPVEQVLVGIEGQPGGSSTAADGSFALRVVPRVGVATVLVVQRVGYQPLRQVLRLPADAAQPLRLSLQAGTLLNVQVRARNARTDGREQVSLLQIDPRAAQVLPSPFGDFNAILKTLPGVVSNNELSSTFSVRGGNYEENLLYVNGFEVYRPFLVTQAQQEGLSFVNPDLVQQIDFSTGGWQPKYGDKLSSVLAIQYKEPAQFAASASASLVGGTAHVEARSDSGRVSVVAGVRYKNAQYVFNALRQQQGNYNPTFYDGQAYVNIGLGPKKDKQRTSLGILGVAAHNDYRFVPVSGQVTFSTGGTSFTRVNIFYDGRERMQYDTYQGGLNLKHNFTARLQVELLGSALITREFEARDVEAAYRFSEVNTDPSSPDFNKTVSERGIGSSFNHARNDLTAQVFTAELRGRWLPGGDSATTDANARHTVRWGLKTGHESIHDQLDEYSFADSADYVPDARRTRLTADLSLASQRTQGYVQHTWAIDTLRTLTYGVRAHYWSVNQQLVVSPRIQFAARSPRHPERIWKLAAGLYAQPPFYRELRNFQGQLNPELRAQKSLHFVVGREVWVRIIDRPFRLNTEAYYKYLTDVIPYEVDNVRLRYYAANNATAYAAGLETRLTGEFVKGVESWISLGLLSTQEKGDTTATYDAKTGQRTGYETLGWIRRPTDQRLTASIFFQDHLPDNPSVRGYVNLVFGTGLPFSPPGLPQYRGDNALVRNYQRVDIGFSKVLAVRGPGPRPHPYTLSSLWLSLEILNILGANNVAGYSYLQDVNGRTYSIPSYLSQRVVNLRAIAHF